MFRVDLEFWVSPTETIEVDIHGNSPNLNAQIVHILEAADLIASMDYFGSQPFPKGIPDNTWVVGNGNHSQNSDPDLSKNVKKYLVCVKSPQLPSTDESFETIRNVCTLLKKSTPSSSQCSHPSLVSISRGATMAILDPSSTDIFSRFSGPWNSR